MRPDVEMFIELHNSSASPGIYGPFTDLQIDAGVVMVWGEEPAESGQSFGRAFVRPFAVYDAASRVWSLAPAFQDEGFVTFPNFQAFCRVKPPAREYTIPGTAIRTPRQGKHIGLGQ